MKNIRSVKQTAFARMHVESLSCLFHSFHFLVILHFRIPLFYFYTTTDIFHIAACNLLYE